MGIVHLDFSKASDKVPHDILAAKLVKCELDNVLQLGGFVAD